MKDLGQEALDEMNRLLLNQQRLKMKLERMDDKQIADLSKKVERLQKQLKEANNVIKYYGMGVVTRTAYWAGQPYMRPEETTSFPEKALEYIKKWGVK